MASIVLGSDLGTQNSSLNKVGATNLDGLGASGKAGEQVYVNTATGNLIIQNVDENLVGSGVDTSILRTYNQFGQVDGDNDDNWRIGFYRKVYNLTGTVNTAGSTVTKINSDGSESLYIYDDAAGKYITTEGAGAHQSLSFNSTNNEWTWSDAQGDLLEIYDANNSGRLTRTITRANETTTYSYDANGYLSQVSEGWVGGQKTYLDYDANGLLTKISLESYAANEDGTADTSQVKTYNTVYYTYYPEVNGVSRLKEVKIDLNNDNDLATGEVYTTTYTYEADSTRIESISQTDGTHVSFTYEQAGADYKVKTMTDAQGDTTVFTYGASSTDVQDALGNITTFHYDAQNRLIKVEQPLIDGIRSTVEYEYNDPNDADNITKIIDANGNEVVYQYDASGNQIYQRDQLGNVIERTYTANNKLATETVYMTADPDGDGVAQAQDPQTSYYIYDVNGYLTYTINAEGGVTASSWESATGNLLSTIIYTADSYDISGLTPATAPTKAQLDTWISTEVDKSQAAKTEYAYDFRGQLMSTTIYSQLDAAGNGVAGTQSTTHFVYDARGRLLKTVDPRASSATDESYASHITYDGLGRVLSTTNVADAVTTTVYDDANNKVIVTSQSGLVTTSTYNAGGELISVTQAGADSTVIKTTSFQYDAAGNLIIETDNDGNQTKYIYDEQGRLVYSIDKEGYVSQSIYDVAGNIVETIAYKNQVVADIDTAAEIEATDLGEAHTSKLIYDNAGRLIYTINAEGYVSKSIYDAVGQITQTISYTNAVAADIDTAAEVEAADLGEETYSKLIYDNAGRLIYTIDAEGYVSETIYNAAGKLIETRAYANKVSLEIDTEAEIKAADLGEVQASKLVYDAAGRLVYTIDNNGYVTETKYDAANNVTKTIQYSDAITPSVVSTVTDVQTLLTTSTKDRVSQARYNELGLATEQLSAEGSNQIAQGADEAATWSQYATKYEYDAMGRSISVTDANGHKTLFFYDERGLQTHTVKVLKDQNLGEVTQTIFNAFGDIEETVVYANKIDTTGLIGGSVNSTLENRLATAADTTKDTHTQFEYSARGLLTKTIDALNNEIRTTYNAFGQVEQTIDQTGTITQFEYNKLGNVIKTIQDLNGNNITTTTKYDAFGRAIESTDANGNVTKVEYDKLGRVIVTEDALGNDTTMTYDAFGRVLTQTDALGHTTTYTYDDANNSVIITNAEGFSITTISNEFGEQDTIIDAKGNQTTFEYNHDGQLVKVIDAEGNESETIYDQGGRTFQTIDAKGTITELEYDSGNRLYKRILDKGGIEQTTTYSYDHKGQATTVIDANNTVTKTIYNKAGQVEKVIHDEGGLNLTTAYSYDAKGNQVTVTEAQGTAQERTTQFIYDDLNRLVYTLNALGEVVENKYDAQGQIIETIAYKTAIDLTVLPANPTTDDINPTGDSVSSKVVYDSLGRAVYSIDALGYVTENRYDGLGQVVETIAYKTAIDLTVLPAEPTTADVNPTGDSVSNRVVYDSLGRAVYSIDALGFVTENRYDGLGQVIETIAYKTAIDLNTLPAEPTTADVNPTGDSVSNRVVYDSLGRAVYSIDALGFVTENRYGALGQVIETIAYKTAIDLTVLPANPTTDDINLTGDSVSSKVVYDSLGRAIYSIDALGYVTESEYNANSQVTISRSYKIAYTGSIFTEDTLESAMSGSTSVEQNFVYDDLGRVRFTIDSLGYVTESEYNANSQVAISRSYKIVYTGSIFTEDALESAMSGSTSVEQNFVYDDLGRVRFTIDALGYVTENRYDALGQVVENIAYKTAIDLTTLPANPTTADINLTGDSVSSKVVYDSLGRAVYSIDALGYVTENRYDGLGQVIETIAYKTAIDLNILPANPTADHINPTGDSVSSRVVYDSLGRIKFSIDALGYVKEKVYDGYGRVIKTKAYATAIDTSALSAIPTESEINVSGYSIDNYRVYDDLGREIFSVNGLGYVTEKRYNALGQVTRILNYQEALSPLPGVINASDLGAIDGDVYSAWYIYNSLGRIVYTVDATGHIAENEYDFFGNVTATRKYADPINIDAFSDEITLSQIPELTGDNLARHAVYDDKMQARYVVDELGYVAETKFDAFGSKEKQTKYTTKLDVNSLAAPLAESDIEAAVNANGSISQSFVTDVLGRERFLIDAEGYVTEKQYDSLGRLQSVTKYTQAITQQDGYTEAQVEHLLDLIDGLDDDLIADSYVVKETYAYDNLGRVVWKRDAEANVEQYGYDSFGNKTIVTNSLGSKLYEYDDLGRVVNELSPEVVITTIDNDQQVSESTQRLITHFEYDAFGRHTARIDAYGTSAQRRTELEYDAAGRQIATEFEDVSILSGSADVSSVDRATFETTAQRRTEIVYDAKGNEIVSKDVAGNYNYKVFNANNKLKYEIDAAGYLTEYKYDGYGRGISLIRYANAIDLSLHTPGTKLSNAEIAAIEAQVAGADNRTIESEYDALGRVVETTQPEVYFLDTTKAKDDVNRSGTISPIQRNEYDEFGRLTKESIIKNPNTNEWIEKNYFYDRIGRKIGEIDALGYLTIWEYDQMGNVTRSVDYAQSLPAQWKAQQTFEEILTLVVTHDAFDESGYGQDREVRYEYDKLGRVISETKIGVRVGTDNQESQIEISGYDSLTNIKTTYAYDEVGNQILTTDHAGNETHTYYDSLNRVVAVSEPTRFISDGTAPSLPVLKISKSNTEFGSTSLIWDKNVASGSVVKITLTNGGFNTVYTAQAIGNNYGIDISSLGDGVYSYQLEYFREGQPTPYVTGTGDIEILAGGSAILPKTQGNVIESKNDLKVNLAMGAGIDGGEAIQSTKVDLKWSDLSHWGSGKIRVTFEYTGFEGNVSEYQLDTFDNSGCNFEIASGMWQTSEDGNQRVIVEKYIDGQLVTIHDKKIGKETERLEFRNVGSTASNVEFQYRDAVLGGPYISKKADKMGEGWFATYYDDVPAGVYQYKLMVDGQVQSEGTVNLLHGGDSIPVASGSGSEVTPIKTFGYDAQGNKVIETRHANSAGFVGLDEYGAPAVDLENDQVIKNVYDSQGRLLRTIGAEGSAKEFSYDIAGSIAKEWQQVTNNHLFTSNNKINLYEYDHFGQQTKTSEVLEDGRISEIEVKYNAFGEIESKITNGSEEYFDYDNAGRMWRSNSGDGVDKVFLSDLAGNHVATLTATEQDLKIYDDAQSADLASGDMRRVEQTYDALGRVIEQRLQSFSSDVTKDYVSEVFHQLLDDKNTPILRWNRSDQIGSTPTLKLGVHGQPLSQVVINTDNKDYYWVDLTGYVTDQYDYELSYTRPNESESHARVTGLLQIMGDKSIGSQYQVGIVEQPQMNWSYFAGDRGYAVTVTEEADGGELVQKRVTYTGEQKVYTPIDGAEHSISTNYIGPYWTLDGGENQDPIIDNPEVKFDWTSLQGWGDGKVKVQFAYTGLDLYSGNINGTYTGEFDSKSALTGITISDIKQRYGVYGITSISNIVVSKEVDDGYAVVWSGSDATQQERDTRLIIRGNTTGMTHINVLDSQGTNAGVLAANHIGGGVYSVDLSGLDNGVYTYTTVGTSKTVSGGFEVLVETNNTTIEARESLMHLDMPFESANPHVWIPDRYKEQIVDGGEVVGINQYYWAEGAQGEGYYSAATVDTAQNVIVDGGEIEEVTVTKHGYYYSIDPYGKPVQVGTNAVLVEADGGESYYENVPVYSKPLFVEASGLPQRIGGHFGESSGTNKINVNWDKLDRWGDGEVTVKVNYIASEYADIDPTQATVTAHESYQSLTSNYNTGIGEWIADHYQESIVDGGEVIGHVGYYWAEGPNGAGYYSSGTKDITQNVTGDGGEIEQVTVTKHGYYFSRDPYGNQVHIGNEEVVLDGGEVTLAPIYENPVFVETSVLPDRIGGHFANVADPSVSLQWNDLSAWGDGNVRVQVDYDGAKLEDIDSNQRNINLRESQRSIDIGHSSEYDQWVADKYGQTIVLDGGEVATNQYYYANGPKGSGYYADANGAVEIPINPASNTAPLRESKRSVNMNYSTFYTYWEADKYGQSYVADGGEIVSNPYYYANGPKGSGYYADANGAIETSINPANNSAPLRESKRSINMGYSTFYTYWEADKYGQTVSDGGELVPNPFYYAASGPKGAGYYANADVQRSKTEWVSDGGELEQVTTTWTEQRYEYSANDPYGNNAGNYAGNNPARTGGKTMSAGTNRLSFSWNDLNAYGGGNIRVRARYEGKTSSGASTGTYYYDKVYSGDSVRSGVNIDLNSSMYSLSKLAQVTVWKEVNGQYIQVHNTTGNTTTRSFEVSGLPSDVTSLQMKYDDVVYDGGENPEPVIRTITASKIGTGWFRFSTSGISLGKHEYTLIAKRSNGTEVNLGKDTKYGVFNLVNTGSTLAASCGDAHSSLYSDGYYYSTDAYGAGAQLYAGTEPTRIGGRTLSAGTNRLSFSWNDLNAYGGGNIRVRARYEGKTSSGASTGTYYYDKVYSGDSVRSGVNIDLNSSMYSLSKLAQVTVWKEVNGQYIQVHSATGNTTARSFEVNGLPSDVTSLQMQYDEVVYDGGENPESVVRTITASKLGSGWFRFSTSGISLGKHEYSLIAKKADGSEVNLGKDTKYGVFNLVNTGSTLAASCGDAHSSLYTDGYYYSSDAYGAGAQLYAGTEPARTGGYSQRVGQNKISLSWNNLSKWGNGDIRVWAKFTGKSSSGSNNQVMYADKYYTASQAASGVNITDFGQSVYSISQLSEVRVWKKVNNQYILVHSTTSDTSTKTVEISGLPSNAGVAVVQFRPIGSRANYQQVSAYKVDNGWFRFNSSGINLGIYEYKLTVKDGAGVEIPISIHDQYGVMKVENTGVSLKSQTTIDPPEVVLPFASSIDITTNSAAGKNGINITQFAQQTDHLKNVKNIKIYKVLNGHEVILYQTSSGSASKRTIEFMGLPAGVNSLEVQYRTIGSDSQYTIKQATKRVDTRFALDIAGTTVGRYEYRLVAKNASGEYIDLGHASNKQGVFEVTGNSVSINESSLIAPPSVKDQFSGQFEKTYSHSSSKQGVLISDADLTEQAGREIDMLDSVSGVEVYKEIDGQVIKLYDTATDMASYAMEFMNVPLEADQLDVMYRVEGSNELYETVAATKRGNGWFVIDTVDLANARYEYKLVALENGVEIPLSIEDELGVFEVARGNDYLANAVTYKPAPKVYQAAGTASGVTYEVKSPVITKTLDRWGNVIHVNNERGVDLEYSYNHDNKLTQLINAPVDVVDENGNKQEGVATVSNYVHDYLGRLVQTTDANGNDSYSRYDTAGNVVAEYDAAGGIKTYAFDILGRKTNTNRGAGKIVYYEYDRNNKVIQEYRDKENITFDYDELGNRVAQSIEQENGSLETTVYGYNTQGKQTILQSAEGRTTTTQYDLNGNKALVLNGLGDTQTWTYDAYGRVLTHKNLGDTNYAYQYNQFSKELEREYELDVLDGVGKDHRYEYAEDGKLSLITDETLNTTTRYEYDESGNRIREQFKINNTIYQDSRIKYDYQNRMTEIWDLRYTTNYEYDAVGNRRHTETSYYDEDNNQQTKNYWYLYDGAGRILISQAELIDGVIQITEDQGISLQYDGAGNRRVATFYEKANEDAETKDLVTESYEYNADNQLIKTHRGGITTSLREYDNAGRVTKYTSYDDSGNVSSWKETIYDKDGLSLKETTYMANGEKDSETRYYEGDLNNSCYDEVGNLLQYTTERFGDETKAYSNTYFKGYEKFDSYKESSTVGAKSTYFLRGSTQTYYDVNGNITRVEDLNKDENSRYFITNAQGQILQKQQLFVDSDEDISNNEIQYYHYANGQSVGTSGRNGNKDVTDFDFNYTPVSDNFPMSAPSGYVVSEGDTLESIAFAVYGDGSLWYLIADENGLNSSSDIQAGMSLSIPNAISNIHNNVGTYKPYSPGQIIGDTTPHMPNPPPPPQPEVEGCSLRNVVSVIVAVVIAVVMIIYGDKSAGIAMLANSLKQGYNIAAGNKAGGFDWTEYGIAAAAAYIGGQIGEGASAMGEGASSVGSAAASSGGSAAGSVGGSLGGSAAGAAGGSLGGSAAGSIAGVAAGSAATGSAAAGSAAAGSAAGSGAGSAAGSAGASFSGSAAASSRDLGTAILTNLSKSVVTNVATQGLSILANRQQGFSWKSVAASALTSPVGTTIGHGIGDNALGEAASSIGSGMFSGAARHALGPDKNVKYAVDDGYGGKTWVNDSVEFNFVSLCVETLFSVAGPRAWNALNDAFSEPGPLSRGCGTAADDLGAYNDAVWDSITNPNGEVGPAYIYMSEAGSDLDAGEIKLVPISPKAEPEIMSDLFQSNNPIELVSPIKAELQTIDTKHIGGKAEVVKAPTSSKADENASVLATVDDIEYLQSEASTKSQYVGGAAKQKSVANVDDVGRHSKASAGEKKYAPEGYIPKKTADQMIWFGQEPIFDFAYEYDGKGQLISMKKFVFDYFDHIQTASNDGAINGLYRFGKGIVANINSLSLHSYVAGIASTTHPVVYTDEQIANNPEFKDASVYSDYDPVVENNAQDAAERKRIYAEKGPAYYEAYKFASDITYNGLHIAKNFVPWVGAAKLGWVATAGIGFLEGLTDPASNRNEVIFNGAYSSASSLFFKASFDSLNILGQKYRPDWFGSGGSRILSKSYGDNKYNNAVENGNITGNGKEYLGKYYEEAKMLHSKDPEFFVDPDSTTFRIVNGKELDAGRYAFVESGGRGHHKHPISHGGLAVPGKDGLAYTGESTIKSSKLDGLDLEFYSKYGKLGAKTLKIHKPAGSGLYIFGLNPRHTEATNFWNKVGRWQNELGQR